MPKRPTGAPAKPTTRVDPHRDVPDVEADEPVFTAPRRLPSPVGVALPPDVDVPDVPDPAGLLDGVQDAIDELAADDIDFLQPSQTDLPTVTVPEPTLAVRPEVPEIEIPEPVFTPPPQLPSPVGASIDEPTDLPVPEVPDVPDDLPGFTPGLEDAVRDAFDDAFAPSPRPLVHPDIGLEVGVGDDVPDPIGDPTP